MNADSPQQSGYLPVATATLCPDAVMDCDLFVRHQGAPSLVLYRRAGLPVTEAELQRLHSEGDGRVYIRFQEAENYHAYLREHVLRNERLPLAARMAALRDVMRVMFQEASAAPTGNPVIRLSIDFGRDLADLVSQSPDEAQDLLRVLEHDYYTFTHVCNVSVYCLLVARRMATLDTLELAELATGALLHDLGKRHVPRHVLNKPDKLTDAEWELVRRHPGDGYSELVDRPELSEGQLMMVYQHHEHLDGSGYPTGVLNDEIHPWAKVCTVADVFDALTCQRPYRRAVPAAEVCDYLRQRASTWFDAGAVSCLVDQIHATP
jgi:HD-GYP domain-containing protein (c-di-GMP phosphodiesterase class II)